MSWQTIATDAHTSACVAEIIADELQVAVKKRGQAVAALAGGRTPQPIYAELGRCEINWARITLLPTDERFVPLTHPDSNERMLRATIGAGAGRLATWVGLRGAATDLPAATNAANERLAALTEPFDLVLLGMGEDGHIASLFPGAAELPTALDPQAALSVYAVHPTAAAPPPPVARLTLGLARLLRTQRVMLLISGETKRSLLEQAMRQPDTRRWPVAALFGTDKPLLQVLYLE